MARSTFVYVTYIRTTPAALWSALTDPQFIRQYWFGMRCESSFTTGAPWRLVSEDGETWDDGEVVEADPPRRLVIRWEHRKRPEIAGEGPSLCTMELTQEGPAVKLAITHAIDHAPSKFIEAVSGGWPKIMANLKSLLETGSAVLVEPYPKAEG